ncbi:aspartate/glutamate racemase family protein [Roseomonas sp. PWR1]|uniref:Aspartate/glutamate racemase family protein n=1 Tax=Roseomonas nitratireducens TaxID=2820810 RepID=A0ABS4ATT7_9PROT|nr:aspartate/glutamate racemase family protein [Neoroseomonas nitratireducens]MBP0464783.1 aspartate/glutamate racemase family protein [Neoroseomonas nitratireducens]
MSPPGVRLGMLTPSSNTVLEPATAALLAGTPDITAHFQRLRVLSITLDGGSTGQFDAAPMLAAAGMLADAKVHAICWNGTSGSWLGLEADRALCAAITDATGIPATTATLALHDALRALAARRIGLVTPYLGSVQAAILANLAAAGYEPGPERHLEDPGNYSFAEHPDDLVARLTAEVAAEGCDAIAIHCTNFRGLRAAAEVTAVPVLDSVAVALWGALRAAGAAPARVPALGVLARLD